jgi:hypothetical protein
MDQPWVELPPRSVMPVLKNLESKLAGLVEGTFSRAFKSEVRPVELARKLAREMEEHKSASLSRTYAPNEYRVFLSPRDRDRFADHEAALQAELAGYLLEHARRERLVLVSRPMIHFETDDRLRLGEFGIQTSLIDDPASGHSEDRAPAAPPPPHRGGRRPEGRPDPVAAPQESSGRTMIYSTASRVAEPLAQPARQRRQTALLLMGGKRLIVGPEGATLGRSRQADIMVDDANVSRQHAEIRPHGGSWRLTDLGSTNGSRLNGRRVGQPEVLKPGDEIELGTTTLTFSLE